MTTQLTTTQAAVRAPAKILKDDWLNEQEVAEELRLSVKTIRMMRYRKSGPPYAKFGRSVRYQRSALEAYKRERTVYPGAL